ncbi:MAG: biopolymer transporter ExbD [Chitinophagales bacterium]|nr:biopolymer transporter ExbD [Chitinophagales bacterium]
MAEIASDGGGKKGGKSRSKKMSTKIDFTPMVDLGFLLITFFMLTTTLSKPKTMEINMPEKDNITDSTKVKASTALTLILSENDKMYYYFGIGENGQPPEVKTTNFSSKGIRKILLERNEPQIKKINALRAKLNARQITVEEFKKEAGIVKSDKNALMVLIKSDDKAKYKNLIDILDEMQITSVGKYAIVDITPPELEMIASVPL